VGKLFERINSDILSVIQKVISTRAFGTPLQPASFCPRHGNPNAQGAFRSAGRISFVTFLWTAKKSKGESRLNEYGVPEITWAMTWWPLPDTAPKPPLAGKNSSTRFCSNFFPKHKKAHP